MVELVAYARKVRNPHKIWKAEGKLPLLRHEYQWKSNIENDLVGTGCEGFIMIHFAENRDQRTW